MASESARLLALRTRLYKGLTSRLVETYVNGSLEHRLPGNLNISFAFVEGESLLMALKDVAVSSGSACTSASLEPSYVLRALGVGEELAHTSIRFGLGRVKDEDDVGTRLVGAPACGDVMKLPIRVVEGVIADAKFKTFGCGSAIASSSLATEMIKGMTLDQAASIKNTQIVEELNLPPVKIHC